MDKEVHTAGVEHRLTGEEPQRFAFDLAPILRLRTRLRTPPESHGGTPTGGYIPFSCVWRVDRTAALTIIVMGVPTDAIHG